MSISYKSILYILLTLCIAGWHVQGAAQEIPDTAQTHGSAAPTIDSSMAISPRFMPVFFAKIKPVEFTPLHYEAIDTSLFLTAQHTPLLYTKNLYQSLGINGQAHQNMIFEYDHNMSFSMITLPYSLYFKGQNDLCMYDVKSPYTSLSYTYGIPNENIFHASHAQQIKQVGVVINLQGISNKGYFIHQGVNTLNLDALIHYQTKRNIYGFTVAYLLNHLKLSENGGLSDYRSFTNRTRNVATNDLGSFNVLFSNGSTVLNEHDAFFQQYVNIRDKKDHYFGTLTHTFQFNKLNSTFLDYDLNNTFYQNQYYISTDTTRDSLDLYCITNALQWSNFDPTTRETDKAYDFKIAGGLQHEYVHTLMPVHISNNFSLFARTNIRLFKVWDIFGSISYTFSKGYNNNDAIARTHATFAINRSKQHFIGLGANFFRVSPDYFLSNNISNYRVWFLDWQKENNLKLNVFWTYRGYKVSFNYFMLDNYVFLDEHIMPTVCEKPINLLQLNAYAPVRTKNFYLDANLALQYSTKKYISVPLFAGKLSTGYCFRIFKNKLRLQLSADLFYNTLYHADAYTPLLHQFYHQETVEVGNFVYLDLSLTMQVERLTFFFRGGNLLAGLPSYRYFTTPHYPMQGRNFKLGIVWRFYD